MRVIGGFIAFLALFGLNEQITFNGIVWLLVGLVLVFLGEILQFLSRTERFVHWRNK